jgi:hypothetical protein
MCLSEKLDFLLKKEGNYLYCEISISGFYFLLDICFVCIPTMICVAFIKRKIEDKEVYPDSAKPILLGRKGAEVLIMQLTV